MTQPKRVTAPRLLSVAEAADRMGVSIRTVWAWIDARRIPVYRLGTRTTRIAEPDLSAFLDSRRTGPPGPASNGP